MPYSLTGIQLPVPQAQPAGQKVSAEAGDFDLFFTRLSSLMTQDGSNPAASEQWLQQQMEAVSEQMAEGLDESAMAEVTAWIEGLIQQQEASAEKTAPNINLLSSSALPPAAPLSAQTALATTAASQPVAVNSGEAARIALDQLPDMAALYSSTVDPRPLKRADSGEQAGNHPLADGLDDDLYQEPVKAQVSERLETGQPPRMIERALLGMSSGLTESAATVSPGGQGVAFSAAITAAAADARHATAPQTPSSSNMPNHLPLTMDGDEGEWGNALSQRLMTMVGDKVKEAHIRLDPPELGQLGIKVVVEDDHLKIRFAAALPHVREMLEGQAERLRAALDGSGFARVDIDVRQQSGDRGGQQQAGSFAGHVDMPGNEPEGEALAEQPREMLNMVGQTALDVFA